MNAILATVLRCTAPALLGLGTSAWAAEEQPSKPFAVPVSVTVDGAGLDLSTPAGAKRLHRQIVAAAESACGGTPRSYKGVARRKYEAEHSQPCVAEAVRAALAQVAAATGRDLEQVAGLTRSDGQVSASR
jgi:UrcA family protein